MKSANILNYILILIVLFSCNEKQKTVISNPNDYVQYLSDSGEKNSVDYIDEELHFWVQKLNENPDSHLYLQKQASLLSARFKINGQIKDLLKSDSLLLEAKKNTNNNNSGILRSLAANAITQHNFREARIYLNNAYKIGDNLISTLLLSFDVDMELGSFESAKRALKQVKNKSTFDYLIRYSKLKDHSGDLDSAIIIMEQAMSRIHSGNNKGLYNWTLSNLGDMYGHAGRVEESYQAYLKVLKNDPEYHYALKGIAWVTYSNDGDVARTKQILNFLKDKSALPDQLLLYAELAQYEGNEILNKQLIEEFYAKSASSEFQGMYNKYRILITSEELKNHETALTLAQSEIKNRSTPLSYDLLAWAHFQKGENDEALRIAKEYVEGQSQEPEILYHLGTIYMANGDKKKAKKYLNEALESSYELGPLAVAKINRCLKG